MDSLSQSSASPTNDNSAQPIEPMPAQRVSTIDLVARFVLFGLLMGILIQQMGPAQPDAFVYPLMIFGALAAGYLLLSVSNVAAFIRQQAIEQPLPTAILPIVLLMPAIVFARSNQNFDVTELLFMGVLLILPASLAVLNVPHLRAGDVSLGLITVAFPILLPFVREPAGANMPPALTMLDIAMRIGAFLLPVLLLLLTTRAQKQRLNFLFVCAVLSLWYAVEFDAFPQVSIAPEISLGYFQFAVVPLFLYVLSAAGRFQKLGLNFQPSPRNISIASTNLGIFAVIAVPLGLFTGYLTSQYAGPTPVEAIGRALGIFLLVALPEEILFRGAILTYFDDTFQWPPALVIGATSVLFGAAHLNNPPNVGWYFVLATLAGIFYARVFLATRNVTASAAVHAAVNWIWWLLFRG
jgi:membrane protease YdiL (CAAX protease family)